MENKRIIFEVDQSLHTQIKVGAFKKGLSIKDYLTNIIKHKFLKDAEK